ncbi:lipopolysaccharide biosynthesis protein [Pararhizobium arenae]|uniref:lipopolysaccharide biosynthesis protein n=1 Tax=Pararhizobium arenae TaxID=1856850 RepID=UPI0013016E99|nr:hypothetical protein [Pararhizobium arenae]
MPAQIGAPLVQLAAVVVWAHLLPAEELGKLMLVVALQDILFSLCLVWWSQFMLRHAPRLPLIGQKGGMAGAESGVVAVCLLAQFMFLAVILLLYIPSAALSFHVAAATFVTVRSLASYCAERARATGRVLAYSVIQLVLPAAALLLALFAAMLLAPRADVVLLFSALPLLAAPLFGGMNVAGFGWDARLVREAWAFGLPAMIAALLAALALNMPRILVDLWFGHAVAGIFSVAFGLGVRLSAVAVMLVTAGAYPLAVRRMELEGRAAGFSQLSANMLLLCLVAAPLGLGFAGIGGSVASLLLPASMQADASVILPLAALAGLVRYLRSHTTDQVFLLMADTRPAAIIAFMEFCMTVLLTATAIRFFGPSAGAAGLLGAASVSATASIVWAVTRFGFEPPVRALSRILLAAALMALCVHMMGRAPSLPALAVPIACGASLYAVCLALLFPGEVQASIVAGGVLAMRRRVRDEDHDPLQRV